MLYHWACSISITYVVVRIIPRDCLIVYYIQKAIVVKESIF